MIADQPLLTLENAVGLNTNYLFGWRTNKYTSLDPSNRAQDVFTSRNYVSLDPNYVDDRSIIGKFSDEWTAVPKTGFARRSVRFSEVRKSDAASTYMRVDKAVVYRITAPQGDGLENGNTSCIECVGSFAK